MQALQEWLSSSTSDVNSATNASWPLVERATSPLLLSEDWAVNLEVSDFANASLEHATLVDKALAKRLRNKDPKVCELALALTECVVKNGNQHPLRVLGVNGGTMTAVADLAKEPTSIFGGSQGMEWERVREKALLVIQELGRTHEGNRAIYPMFYQTYAGLTSKGVIFPSHGAFSPAENESVQGFVSSSRKEVEDELRAVSEEDIEKLEHDITVLECKLTVGEQLLKEKLPLDSNEVLDVLDFLLQCKPRMVKLIEASAMGLLDDYFLEKCLKVNDRLCNTVARLQGEEVEPLVPPSRQRTRSRSGSSAANVPKLRAPPASPLRSQAKQPAPKQLEQQNLDDFILPPPAPAPAGGSSSSLSKQTTTIAKPMKKIEGNPFDLFGNDDDDDEKFPFVPQKKDRDSDDEHENLLS